MKLRLILLGALLLSGCAYDRFVEYGAVEPEHFPVLTATGVAPLSSQQGDTEQEKAHRAMRAAKLDAYRELAEQIYGQKISGTSHSQDFVLESDEFQAQVSGIVRGAKVVRSYPVGDSYVTELELDYRHVWALYQQQPKPTIRSVRYY